KGLPDLFEVRGEVYFPIAGFEKLNREMEGAGKARFVNPRNTAPRSVRQIDPNVTASRDVQTSMYTLHPAGPAKSQWDVLNALDSGGVRVNNNRRRLNAIDEVLEYHAEWRQRRRCDPRDRQRQEAQARLEDAGELPGVRGRRRA